MIITQEEVSTLIEYLEGSCESLAGAVDTITDGRCTDGDLTSEQLGEIDSAVMLCDGCGWWTDAGDMDENRDGDQTCSNCRDDE